MMAGNPSWWIMSNMKSSQNNNHQTSSFLPTCPSLLAQYHEVVDNQRSTSSSSILSLNSSFPNEDDDQEELPHSWRQLLVGGLTSEEGKFGLSHHFHTKKLENWEEQILLNPSIFRGVPHVGDHIKQENSQSSHLYGITHGDVDDDHEIMNHNENSWSHQQIIMPLSSPRSSVTSLTSNLFDFSGNKGDGRTQILDQYSSECNSTSTGVVSKKARVVRSSPPQPPLKVRKEKLGERITALHQLVSPFGKTDTASVLFEAIGHIRILQGQIQALSSPYLCNASTNMRNQHSGNQDGLKKELKSRGLCLVPVSCTRHVGNDYGADYWAPLPGGGF